MMNNRESEKLSKSCLQLQQVGRLNTLCVPVFDSHSILLGISVEVLMSLCYVQQRTKVEFSERTFKIILKKVYLKGLKTICQRLGKKEEGVWSSYKHYSTQKMKKLE